MITALNPQKPMECYMTKFSREVLVFQAFLFFFPITQNLA